MKNVDLPTPRTGIVLGSGLGGFVDALEDKICFEYGDIPHFPRSSAPGHAGVLWRGTVHGTPVVVMQGRHHYYEGCTPAECVYGVRSMISLGAKNIILTNAAGTIDPEVKPGDLRIIADHINLTGQSPLRGTNDPDLGERFVPMNGAYNPELGLYAMNLWRDLGSSVREGVQLYEGGVYALMPGPEYETLAEIKRLKISGANLVGMSTVFETIAARHMEARVLGISCVTNYAAGVNDSVPNEQEVIETAKKSSGAFIALMQGLAGTIR